MKLNLLPFSIYSLNQSILSTEGRHFPPALRRCISASSCPLRENVGANGPGADRILWFRRPVCKHVPIGVQRYFQAYNLKQQGQQLKQIIHFH